MTPCVPTLSRSLRAPDSGRSELTYRCQFTSDPKSSPTVRPPQAVRQPGTTPWTEPNADDRASPIMDDQPVLTGLGRVVDEAVGAVEPIRMLVAHPLCLLPHLLAAVRLHPTRASGG